MTDQDPRDSKEGRIETPFVAVGIIIGAGLGVVVAASLQANTG